VNFFYLGVDDSLTYFLLIYGTVSESDENDVLRIEPLSLDSYFTLEILLISGGIMGYYTSYSLALLYDSLLAIILGVSRVVEPSASFMILSETFCME